MVVCETKSNSLLAHWIGQALCLVIRQNVSTKFGTDRCRYVDWYKEYIHFTFSYIRGAMKKFPELRCNSLLPQYTLLKLCFWYNRHIFYFCASESFEAQGSCASESLNAQSSCASYSLSTSCLVPIWRV